MANNRILRHVKSKRTSTEDARFDATAMCLSLLMDGLEEGDNGPLKHTADQLGELMQEPERLASATITLLLMIRTLANAQPLGWIGLCNYLVDAIPEVA